MTSSKNDIVELYETNAECLYMVHDGTYYEIGSDVHAGFEQLARIALGVDDGDLDGCRLGADEAEELRVNSDWLRLVATYSARFGTYRVVDNMGILARQALGLLY